MSRVDLLLKLSIDRDRRTNKGEVEQHSVKHAFKVYSENLGKMLLMNLVYAFIFALPFMFCVFIWPMLLKSDVFARGNYNFIGQIGIGYPGVVNTMAEGYKVLFKEYFHLYIPLLSASIVPMVFGLSGVFHCMRGYMWGENVRPVKSFFRGIKRLWKPFLIVAVAFGAIMCGVLYGAFWHISLLKTGADFAGSWILFIFLIIFVWVMVAILYFLLPIFACYRFSLKDSLKNSSLLFLILWPGALFASAFSIGLFMLSLAGTVFNFLIAILFLGLGFTFLAALWTSCAQKAFGNYILPQFESRESGGKVKMESRRGVNPYKEAKAKKKAQEQSAIGQASRARAKDADNTKEEAPVEKKKKKPTKHVSYKRKK